MQYLTPFDIIKRDLHLLATQGSVRINITYDEFLRVVSRILAVVEVDEAWYVAAYPDVAAAISAGVHKTAKEHFILHGYFEGRLPYEIPVDEKWYLATYLDVAEAIKRGDHRSAAEHFRSNGYLEGRLPSDPTAPGILTKDSSALGEGTAGAARSSSTTRLVAR